MKSVFFGILFASNLFFAQNLLATTDEAFDKAHDRLAAYTDTLDNLHIKSYPTQAALEVLGKSSKHIREMIHIFFEEEGRQAVKDSVLKELKQANRLYALTIKQQDSVAKEFLDTMVDDFFMILERGMAKFED